MNRLLLSVVVIVLASVTVYGQTKPTAVTGVWRVTERTEKTIGPGVSTNRNPQPGVMIFTKSYYSIMVVSGDKARPSLPQDTSSATAAELLAVFVPFTANSGTYEIKGDELTTHAIVAKHPAGMQTSMLIKFKLDGSQLTLTLVSENGVPVPTPTIVKLTRVE
jgi:hypothetical protein